MIRSAYLTTAALAAALAVPAWAQFTDSAKTSTTARPATAAESPSTTVAKSDAATGKPLCSELNHPNAGKLADKSTGLAKERSASPVHQDCIPDTSPAASAAGTGNATLGSGSTAAGPSVNGGVGATLNTNPSTGGRADVNSSLNPGTPADAKTRRGN